MGMSSGSARSLRTYQRIAPFYDFLDLPFELVRYRTLRPLLFHGLSGRLLDAGVGTGRNIAYYPSGTEVFGVDLSPAMLTRAARRSRQSHATLHLIEMDLVQLAFPDEFFDAAVGSFVFCTMPAEARMAALREIRRVLTSSGRVRLLEYAPPRSAFRRAVGRVWQPWVEWAFGARLNQDIELELSEAALKLTGSRYVNASIKLIEAVPA